jgi:uncharacterized protein YjbI with pentapeptide repeats
MKAIQFVLSLALLALKVVAVDVTIEKSVTVKWKSEMGKFYSISTTTNSPAQWQIVEGSIIGNGDVLERSYPTGGSASALFKVEEIMTPNFTGRILNHDDFSESSINGVNFDDTEITISWFIDSKAIDTRFERAFIHLSDFTGANMNFSTFKDAQMTLIAAPEASFRGCNFSGTTLFSMDFTNAEFNGALFTGATIIFGDFTGAKNLNLEGALCTLCTMPDGTIRDDP